MSWRRDVISFVAVAGFVAVCFVVLSGVDLPKSMENVAMILVGQLSMKFGTVIDYYLGSSAGSAAKDQTINQVTKP